MDSSVFSGSLVLNNSDSTVDQDEEILNKLAKLNSYLVGNSYYCYIYGKLILLINPDEFSLSALKSIFNDGGKGITPLSFNNKIDY